MAEVEPHLPKYSHRYSINVHLYKAGQYPVVLFKRIYHPDPEQPAVPGTFVMPPVLALVTTELPVCPAAV